MVQRLSSLHGYSKASGYLRVIAYILDAAMVSLFLWILQFLFPSVDQLFSISIVIYSIVWEGLISATPGKFLLGIRVVRKNGKRMNMYTALRRQVGKSLISLTFGTGAIRILAPHRLQAAHDDFADCYVLVKN